MEMVALKFVTMVLMVTILINVMMIVHLQFVAMVFSNLLMVWVRMSSVMMVIPSKQILVQLPAH